MADIPPRTFECRLALIEPSAVLSPDEEWTDEAMEMLQQHADSGIVEIEVYSVVDGVSNVVLKKDNSSFNEILMEKGYARPSDESYMSKVGKKNFPMFMYQLFLMSLQSLFFWINVGKSPMLKTKITA